MKVAWQKGVILMAWHRSGDILIPRVGHVVMCISVGLRLPTIRTCMNDMTIITTTKPCTRRMLQKPQENIEWAKMKFKPSKSHSIFIIKAKRTAEQLYISGEPISSTSRA